jgi:hypothetical protein
MTKEIEYEFKGVNTTSVPVRILKIERSCGCQSVTQSTEVVQPGGEITLTGKITLNPFGGIQKKQLTVMTDQGPPQILVVNVLAPESVKVEPSTLMWEENDNSEREVVVSIPPGNESTMGAVKVLGTGFTVTEEKTETGAKLKVTPTGTQGRTALRIETSVAERAFPRYVRLEKRGTPPANPAQAIPAPAQVPAEAAAPTTTEGTANGVSPTKASKIKEARLLMIEALKKLSEAENAQ